MNVFKKIVAAIRDQLINVVKYKVYLFNPLILNLF
jgi:hypothetical protein